MKTGANRSQILERIRRATGELRAQPVDLARKYALIPRAYVQTGKLTCDERNQLLIGRLREYDVEVSNCTHDTLVANIAHALTSSGRRKFIAPPGIPSDWQVQDVEWVQEAEAAEGALTAASCAIADSGTLALHHTVTEGRRVISLLPDWHLCVLLASQVVETLPEYFARFLVAPSLVTWISGPSATADIELTRIKGVHGPRHLRVLVVEDQ